MGRWISLSSVFNKNKSRGHQRRGENAYNEVWGIQSQFFFKVKSSVHNITKASFINYEWFQTVITYDCAYFVGPSSLLRIDRRHAVEPQRPLLPFSLTNATKRPLGACSISEQDHEEEPS